ncbi:hypothetical protein B0H14DRAFT_2695825 [Mycena olivaceomarginata]|nr:hypothetical protein B0H14DRAFT_2779701 [Mycena olivaceomarginata]KAJ7887225.1 hypothetical protein B0H14DRAFT_2695825 [Mycena olivaceomarginata]
MSSLALMSAAALPDIRDTFGAVYIGVIFAAFFQGLLTVQAYIYYEQFPRDSWVLKTLVAVVWLTDLAHLGVVGSIPWHTLVVNWGNVPVLSSQNKERSIHVILVGIPSILCQAFFLHRLWKMSQKKWTLVVPLALASLAVFGLEFFLSIQNTINPDPTSYIHDKKEAISMFTIGAATDFCIAVSMVYYLQRGKAGFDTTNFILTRLIQYTVATGLASSLLAVACVIADFLKPKSYIFIAMHFSLGRMYTNALLATLNSRRKLRSALGNTQVDSWSTPPGPSGGPVVAMPTVTQCTTVIANEFNLDRDSFQRSKDAESQPQW